jgi:hypothetical protein
MIDEFKTISIEINETDNLKKYLTERLLKLEKESEVENLGIDTENSVYEGYINSNSPIKASKNSESFYLDNINIYYDFILKYKDHIKEETILKMFADIQEYFTDNFGLIGSQQSRDMVYASSLGLENEDHLSVQSLVKKGGAMCLERSAILQNLLSLLGFKIYFIYGSLEKIKDDEMSYELHAYNVIKITSKDYLIYDITNPISLELNTGKCYFPAINVISLEKFNNLMSGDNYVFDNDQIENLFNNKANVLNEISRIYKINEK